MFPHLAGLPVERAFLAGRSVRIQGVTTEPAAGCPACRRVSRRVHSRYERRVADTAVAGREVVIQLRSAGSFCAGGCGRKTFAEQVPGLTIRYGWVSAGLTPWSASSLKVTSHRVIRHHKL